jgi:hypothetical protein
MHRERRQPLVPQRVLLRLSLGQVSDVVCGRGG